MIEIKNLTKRYGKYEAVKDMNLTVTDGSIFGLVGTNGAGKSTLLSLLAGVFMPDSGEIRIDGEPVFENEKKKKEIFFLPDDPFYTSGMNGERLKELYGTFYKLHKQTFKDMTDAYKLDLTLPLGSFSKGMKRQMFACFAFASNAKYLFLDEVFDGLDPVSRLIFKRGLVDAIDRTGGTAVLSSHSLRELEDICDSYGLIDGKQLISSGSITDSVSAMHKFCIAFAQPVSEAELGMRCESFQSSGKIITIVVRDNKESILANIERLNPLVVDEMPVDFEEFFISEISAKGTRK